MPRALARLQPSKTITGRISIVPVRASGIRQRYFMVPFPRLAFEPLVITTGGGRHLDIREKKSHPGPGTSSAQKNSQEPPKHSLPVGQSTSRGVHWQESPAAQEDGGS